MFKIVMSENNITGLSNKTHKIIQILSDLAGIVIICADILILRLRLVLWRRCLV